MKREHAKKMAAPIVITILFLVYLVVYAVLVIVHDNHCSDAILLRCCRG